MKLPKLSIDEKSTAFIIGWSFTVGAGSQFATKGLTLDTVVMTFMGLGFLYWSVYSQKA